MQALQNNRENHRNYIRKTHNRLLFEKMRSEIFKKTYNLISRTFCELRDIPFKELDNYFSEINQILTSVQLVRMDIEQYSNTLTDLSYLILKHKFKPTSYISLSRQHDVKTLQFVIAHFMYVEPSEVEYWLEYMSAADIQILSASISLKNYEYCVTDKMLLKIINLVEHQWAISLIWQLAVNGYALELISTNEVIQKIWKILRCQLQCQSCFYEYIEVSLIIVKYQPSFLQSQHLFEQICKNFKRIVFHPKSRLMIQRLTESIHCNQALVFNKSFVQAVTEFQQTIKRQKKDICFWQLLQLMSAACECYKQGNAYQSNK